MFIACAPGTPAKYHPYQANAIALNRGHQIKSRCVNIAGFNPVCSLIAGQQTIVIFIFPAIPHKMGIAEIVKILREITAHCDCQLCHIACGANLCAVRQARGIFKGCARHPQRLGLAGHFLGEFAFGAA